MLRETNHHDNRLPEGPDGYAIPRADLLHDQITECGLNDPDFGDPATWPSWTDHERPRLGCGTCREEFFDDLPDDDREYPF